MKSVRENPEKYGFEGYRDWERWCKESLNMTRGNANRFIKVYNRFVEESDAPVHRLPNAMSVLYSLTDFTGEELGQEYKLPNGEKKKPTEMSRREIEELKRKLKAEKAERERLEQQRQHRYSSYLYKIVPLRLKFRRIALGVVTYGLALPFRSANAYSPSEVLFVCRIE